MGRAGGGGGGHHSASHGSMGHHSSHSSFGGGHSSFGGGHPGVGGGPRGPVGGGPRGPRGPVYYSRPYRTHIYTRPIGGTGCGCMGCGSYFPVFLVILLILLIICSTTGNTTIGGGYLIDDSIADQYAEEIYQDEFKGAADGAVLLIAEAENWEDEYDTFACGSDAEKLLRAYKDDFWTKYDTFYDDDVARQLSSTLYAIVDLMERDGAEAISDSDLSYKGQNYIEDNVNAFDSFNELAKSLEYFYDCTGIRLFVVSANYNTFGPDYGAKPESGTDFTTVFIVLIVAIAVVLLVYILYKWWKARKKQKNIEDENTIKILNTPLETFGDTDLKDTAAKYDSDSTDNS